MRNIKHTIISIAAIVMVGTLSFFQISSMSKDKLERDMRLGTSNQTQSISISAEENEAETASEDSSEKEETTEEDIIEESEQEPAETTAPTAEEIEEKSNPTSAYAKVTGSAELYAAPSDEAQCIGRVNGAEQVVVLESTEGWYRVSTANGVAGYLKKDFITIDKAVADDAALQQDNYKRATVSAASGVSVRSEASQDSARLDTIDSDTKVIITGFEDNYIKVLYGDDYKAGYVIDTGLELTGEWVNKDQVHSEILRVAEEQKRRAEEERRRQEAAASSQRSASSKSTASVNRSGATASSSAIVNTAMKYLGVPYVWGGTSPRGFDCSGLVQYVFKQHGISLPRTAATQRGAGRSISKSELQAGDLVFFGSGGRITHVGIYVGNGNMIHAPHTGDVVKIASINSSYYTRRYAGAVRAR